MPASSGLIAKCNEVVQDYLQQGLRLSLRQLYYQMVVRNIVPNTERAYRNLGKLISNARLAGLIDWSAIEDRIRVPRKHPEWNTPGDAMEQLIGIYRLPRWNDQPWHVEVWIEKDALTGVIEPITQERHVILMVNRGYSSQSAMYDANNRIKRALRDGKKCVILYLGDLDPSGEDMVRDIDDRLNEVFGAEVKVVKLGITEEQVAQYNPPPNPAKMSDSRAAGFVDKHGYQSYEVDALPPDVLAQLIRGAIDQYEDPDLMEAVKRQEDADIAFLKTAKENVMGERDLGNDE